MKVFSKKKFIEVMGESNYKDTIIKGKSWVDECDNKPVINNKIKYVEELDYDICDAWCVEVKDD